MTSSACPLCLGDLSPADIRYELNCPTPGCYFNYCSSCIENLCQSAADGYQEASDGSRQVKVHVQCPQCREKYQSKTYPCDSIVSSVLILRKAASLEAVVLSQCDSELSATELGQKDRFLKQYSLEDLQDSTRRLKVYKDEIGKGGGNEFPELDWESWRPHIKESSSSSSAPRTSKQAKPWADPTLFYGLDELITNDEKEFVTALLTSGKVECLSQAAHILNGILDMAASRTVEQMANFTTVSKPAKLAIDPQTMQKVRKKYPLPMHMPRCVRLAVYNPDSDTILKFDKKNPQSLALVGVRGLVGRLGLRKGDVVTHIDGETVSTQQDFVRALQLCQGQETLHLVVNANKKTAEDLKIRKEKMQKDGVNFN